MSTSRDKLLEKIDDLENEMEELKFENYVLSLALVHMKRSLEIMKKFDNIKEIKEGINKLLDV